MLGYVLSGGRGEADRVLAGVVARLADMGWPLAGVVQINTDHADPGRACHMDLDVLQDRARIRISQDLGAMSRGCRLDPSALETAVGLVEAALQGGPRLLVINKFGKQEVDGRGFRPVIGQAMAAGVPVLTTVSQGNLEGFQTFAEGLGQALPPDEGAVMDWVRRLG